MGLVPYFLVAQGPGGPDSDKPVPFCVFDQHAGIVEQYSEGGGQQLGHAEPGAEVPEYAQKVYVEKERDDEHYKSVIISLKLLDVLP